MLALQELEGISAGQRHPNSWSPITPMPSAEPSSAVGRHHASRSRRDELLRRHGARFASFSAIGGGIFIAGLVLQAALTSGLHVASFVSYLIQAVVSVQASYFLNRWVTWKGVKAPFWGSLARFNLQKVLTVTVNLIMYAGLLKLGMNYLLANILLTIVFTFVNYIGADRFVFLRGSKQLVAAVTGPMPILTGPMPVLQPERQVHTRRRPAARELPTISVVIPVRSNESTIRAAVDSILGQDYPILREVILVGSPGDSTWAALEGMRDPRLFIMETETPPGIRDANFKRDLGIRQTTGALIALIDSDMVIPPDWMSNAVRLLMENEVDCVAGVMHSIRDDFWGRFVDRNRLSAKTPRAETSYLVTVEGFGAAGYKPPITADILFTRKMYERCPIDSSWSHGSLEDYEWFWRVVESGHQVLVSDQLFGWHHHRSGLNKLIAEYRRSARGCAYFIRAHRDSPFAQKRMTQAILLPLGVLAVLIGLAVATVMGAAMPAGGGVLALASVALVLLCGREFARTRTAESLIYPVPALILGANYTVSLAANLIRNAPTHAVATGYGYPDTAVDTSRRHTGLSRLLHLLTAVLLVQAGLSLSLVWSNTAFNDEGEYLWGGHLQIAHWLHGSPLPTTLTDTFSGSPIIYPPIGAMADAVGGLAGARLLSLLFMLVATGLLYSVAQPLLGQPAALFAAAAAAISEPFIRLGAYATYDAMSVMLTALAAWLALRAGYSRYRGELVFAAGVVLALANATAYSGVVIDPMVIAFAVLAWARALPVKKALACAAWLAVTVVALFIVAVTVARSWHGFLYTIVLRGTASGFAGTAGNSASTAFILKNVWGYSGAVLILAAAGVIIAIWTETGVQRLLVIALGCAALIAPLAQIHDHTETSLDKHLAYGVWFAAMAGGYACGQLLGRFPARRLVPSVLCCTLALAYAAADNWEAAWYKQHSWGNSSSFNAALQAATAHTNGRIMVSGAASSYAAKYYLSDGYYWPRWSTTFPDAPARLTAAQKASFYTQQLERDNFSVIALAYDTTLPALPTNLVVPGSAGLTQEAILSIVTATTGSAVNPMAWLPGLTIAIEHDPSYRLVATGPYNTITSNASYAIWVKVGQ